MSIPTDRDSFKEFCLRRLGKPVLEINIADEQIDDCVDMAMITFWDFHYDGSERAFYKHKVTANNRPTSIYGLTIENGGLLYSNSDVLVFSGGGGIAANGTIVTNGNGYITSANFPDNGSGFATAPNVEIVTSTGSNGAITAELGGFVKVPPNIIGIADIFPIGLAESGVNSIFNIRYQIALNDLYTLSNIWKPDYYIVRQDIALIEEIFVGKQPLRFNKYTDRVFIDMDWSAVADNTYLILDVYKLIDPEDFGEVWSDRWLQRYCTALFKEQWGTNLKKFGNLPMVGGLTFNGQQIYDEAVAQKEALEEELYNTWSLPIAGMMG